MLGESEMVVIALLWVLVQWTVVPLVALGLARAFRHDPAARECVLLPALFALVLCPLATLAMMGAEVTWIEVPSLAPGRDAPSDLGAAAAPPGDEVAAVVSAEPYPEALEGQLAPAPSISSVGAWEPGPSDGLHGAAGFAEKSSESESAGSIQSRPVIGWVRLLRFGLGLWSVGTLVCLALLLRSWLAVRRFQATARPVSPELLGRIRTQLTQVSSRYRSLHICESPMAPYPLVAGLLRPMIVLPIGVERALRPDELESVLRHEAAHIVRHDQAVLLIQRLVAAFLWFHPLVHWLNRALIQAREEVCDNYVLQWIDGCRYGQALLLVARSYRPGLSLTAGLFHGEWRLEHRVSGMLSRRRRTVTHRRRSMVLALALTAAGVLCAGGTSWARRTDDAEESSATQGAVETSQGSDAEPRSDSHPQATDEAKGNMGGESELQRIRAMIHVLRQYRVFERSDAWAGAIRELAEMEDRALPELIRELDETDRDASLRALGFTLRAIGDPRAVPALIRAIPKTLRPPGSDCAIHVSDPDSRRFMEKHQRHPSTEDRISYGRPVNEILGAIERLTGHEYPAGKDPLRHVFLARDAQKADPAKEEAKRKRFADRMEYWQSWWAEHRDEFVTEKDLETVELPAGEGDPIAEAALAEFGPMFPAGPGAKLTPVREVVLENSSFWNAPSYIDFDTGRVYEKMQGIDSIPAEQLDRAPLPIVGWERAMGIDARCQGMFQVEDLHLWRIDNARWETFEQEIKGRGPVALGPEAKSRLTPGEGEPPATYLFTTREGGAGILRLSPHIPGTRQRRLRYRMIEETLVPDSSPSRASPGPSGSTPFEFVGALTLRADEKPLFGFGSMATISLPTNLVAQGRKLGTALRKDEGVAAWCRKEGVDLVAEAMGESDIEMMAGGYGSFPPGFARPPVKVQLRGFDMEVFRVLPNSFDTLTVEQVADFVSRWKSQSVVRGLLLSRNVAERPDTFAIKTRNGRLGVVQLTAVKNDPDSLMVRYRLQKR